MQVKTGDRIYLDARTKAEPAESVVTIHYYTQLPQIRLTSDSTGRPTEPETSTAVTLDGNDIAELVECAIRHPAPSMRYAVLAAIWNHAESLRQIFQFGHEAPAGFSEIRKIVGEALGKRSVTPELPVSNAVKPAVEPLLPLPAHLRDRGRR
jgi:hypothetical protein